MPMSQCTNATYQQIFHKETFQSNSNHPHADRYLGNIVNKFTHVQSGAGAWESPHGVEAVGMGDPHVGRWHSWGWGQRGPRVNKV